MPNEARRAGGGLGVAGADEDGVEDALDPSGGLEALAGSTVRRRGGYQGNEELPHEKGTDGVPGEACGGHNA